MNRWAIFVASLRDAVRVGADSGDGFNGVAGELPGEGFLEEGLLQLGESGELEAVEGFETLGFGVSVANSLGNPSLRGLRRESEREVPYLLSADVRDTASSLD